MKRMILPAVVILAALGSSSAGFAETKLLARTPAGTGATIGTRTDGKAVLLLNVDVSAYDRLRVVAIARRPSSVLPGRGFGAPVRLLLDIGQDNDDLGLLENGALALNPTETNGDAPARTVRTTALFDNPVITRLLVWAVGPTAGTQTTTVDLYVYGQTPPTTAAR